MSGSRSLPFIAFLLILLLGFVPSVALILLIISLVLVFAHGTLQLGIARSVRATGTLPLLHLSEPANREAFVSIHLPTYAEPPHLVCATIDSILAQTHRSFELIVIDNNTRDTKLWKPVEEYCKHLDKVQFVHYDDVKDYKAGALNICRKLIDKRTKYVFTVDADYVLEPTCLAEAVKAAEAYDAALIQLPQAYSNVMDSTKGLQTEYRHFFDVFGAYSTQSESMLGTGTMSLIRLSALEAVGGWPVRTITEDAELGLLFQRAGFRTRLLNKRLGFGQMPLDMGSLRKQRLRWVFGNFQALVHRDTSLAFIGKHVTSCLGQLTCWINFAGLAFLSLALESLRVALLGATAWTTAILVLSLGTIGSFLLLKWLFFYTKSAKDIHITNQVFKTHLFYLGEGTFGWWDALFRLKKPFVRTNKFGSNEQWADVPFRLPLGLALSGVLLAYSGFWLFAFSALIVTLLLSYSIASTQRQLAQPVPKAVPSKRAATVLPLYPSKQAV